MQHMKRRRFVVKAVRCRGMPVLLMLKWNTWSHRRSLLGLCLSIRVLHRTCYAIPLPPVPTNSSPAPVPFPPVWVLLPSRSSTFVTRSRPGPADTANGLYYMPSIYTRLFIYSTSYQCSTVWQLTGTRGDATTISSSSSGPDSIDTWTVKQLAVRGSLPRRHS